MVRFHERIQLNNNFIDENDLTEILDECYSANKDRPITYFEITTCAAILAMSRKHADYVLLEVGLGGRLDSTNVIIPNLSIITNISLEHTEYLGETLEEIAKEKAGIIKKKIPVVIGERHKKTYKVFEKTLRVEGTEFVWNIKPNDSYYWFKEKLEGIRFDSIAWGLQNWVESLLIKWTQNTIRKGKNISNFFLLTSPL